MTPPDPAPAPLLPLQDPQAILAVLLLIEGGVFLLAQTRAGKRFFSVLPAMFWIYFLPSLAANAGLIPAGEHWLYVSLVRYLLPPALLLLLISVDLPAIGRLGGRALAMMLAGSVGVVLGGALSLTLFQPWLPADAWKGFGSLAGSWIGGSANMIAVRDAVEAGAEIYSPMVVVDIVVGYGWMALVLALSRVQGGFDRWNRADGRIVAELNERMSRVQAQEARPTSLAALAGLAALAAVGGWLARLAGAALPQIPKLVNASTWTILIVTTGGVLLSMTPVRRLEARGASSAGYLLLYFVLTAVGAQADLSSVGRAPLLIVAGVVWIAVHALCLLAAARALRAPMFLTATASQANIGGPASAPVVAAAYQPALAAVGLLMAVLGNIIGTYLGIVCAQFCRGVAWLYGIRG